MTVTSVEVLPRPRDVSDAFGIYVHVPFCSHRCWYCDFNAYAGLDELAPAYMDALARDARLALSAPELADLSVRPLVTSVFIGGGTPSLVAASSVAAVVDAVRDSWPVADDVEITIECNPESTDAAKLDAYLAAGINRVSFGVQSLDATLLQTLGRTHSPDRALEAIALAQACGFSNVSADLIFGVPGEDDATWRASVEGIVATGVPHVSCYALIYEEGTPLDSWRKLGKVTPVDDDEVADRWEIADALLSGAGLERYELSNWGRPGRESRHNGTYWACDEYLGIGAGAHSHLATVDGAARRSWTLKAPERYIRSIDAGDRPIAGAEAIDRAARATEVMLLGLRRTEGVSEEAFEGLVGRSLEDTYAPAVETGVRKGVLERVGGSVRATRPFLLNQATVLFA